jgi:hypothetical protein
LDTTGGRNETPCEAAVLAERTLSRARAGDEEAFRERIDPYRRELQPRCYPILSDAACGIRPRSSTSAGVARYGCSGVLARLRARNGTRSGTPFASVGRARSSDGSLPPVEVGQRASYP